MEKHKAQQCHSNRKILRNKSILVPRLLCLQIRYLLRSKKSPFLEIQRLHISQHLILKRSHTTDRYTAILEQKNIFGSHIPQDHFPGMHRMRRIGQHIQEIPYFGFSERLHCEITVLQLVDEEEWRGWVTGLRLRGNLLLSSRQCRIKSLTHI